MPGLSNYKLSYRPLMAGIAVSNPNVDRFGTIGLILTSNGVDRWILGCYHVLGRENGTAALEGEPVYQPRRKDVPQSIGSLRLAQSSQSDDFALAEISQAIVCSPGIFGLGWVGAATQPQIGQKVLKSGVGSGVTQGRVVDIQGNTVHIDGFPEFPADYELSSGADSGAVWVTADTHAPVALHQRGNPQGGKEIAIGFSMVRLLTTLGMHPLN